MKHDYSYPGRENDMPGYSYKKDGGMKGRMKNEKNYGNCVIEESAVRGQVIRTESSPDKSSHAVDKREGLLGMSMPDKGTSHSLKPSMYNEKPLTKSPNDKY